MIFQSKQTRKKVPLNIFRGFEERKMVRVMFSMPKDRVNGRYCAFSSYKQRNKVAFVYLECVLQQDC